MYLPINFFILPLFVDVIQNQEFFGIMQISALFTCVALLRKYTIRRWFEKMRLRDDMNCYYLDIETTGLDPLQSKIITIQYMELERNTAKPVGPLNILKGVGV